MNNSKKYNVLYVDPPWKYADQKNNDPAMGGITYPVMEDEDIYSLPVHGICDKHSSLFLWATMPKLEEALETIRRWGFSYKTCAFVWVKLNPKGEVIEIPVKGRAMPDLEIKGGLYSGMGHWVNGNVELCLFAKKGTPKRVAKNVKQLIFSAEDFEPEVVLAPRSRHSAKPPIVRGRIVQLMGDVPRIELFARNTAEGWDSFGNHLNDIDIRESLLRLAA